MLCELPFSWQLLFSLLLLSGCFTTKVYFDRNAQGSISDEWDGGWYHGAINGLVDLSGPIRLSNVCPDGVAYSEQRESFLNGVVKGFENDVLKIMLEKIHNDVMSNFVIIKLFSYYLDNSYNFKIAYK